MELLKLIFAAGAGYIFGIFLIVLPTSFFNFGIAVSLMLEGKGGSDSVWMAVRQLLGMGVTGVLFVGIYKTQGIATAVVFTVSMLWPLWMMIWKGASTDG